MSYASVDPQIRAWVDRHSLTLFKSFADRETRFAYASSKAGECFQIWIDPPEEGQVCIHATGIEGRKGNDAPEDSCIPISDFGGSSRVRLFATVICWMAPSERFLPK